MSNKKPVIPNKLEGLRKFQKELNDFGSRLEAAGENYHEELKLFYAFIQKEIFRMELSGLESDMKILAYQTYYVLTLDASKDELCEAGTKLLMHLEEMIREEERKQKREDLRTAVEGIMYPTYQQAVEDVLDLLMKDK